MKTVLLISLLAAVVVHAQDIHVNMDCNIDVQGCYTDFTDGKPVMPLDLILLHREHTRAAAAAMSLIAAPRHC